MLGIIGDDVESLLKSGFANFGYFRPQSVHLARIQAPNLRIIGLSRRKEHDEREGYADRSALVDGKNIMKLWT